MKRTIRRLLAAGILFIFGHTAMAQEHTDANVFGHVTSEGEHIPFVSIYIDQSKIGTSTDESGHFMLIDVPTGEHVIIANALGYAEYRDTVSFTAGTTLEYNIELESTRISLDEVVVTGTKTFKRQTESPVIVNVITSKTLENTQSCNLSEGLKFQPGLRVEVDCQTCNYSQLRMNGLGGAYSQILINGRPIFSPLTGLYGMEQIPTNMVDRIEVVRGGGSSLYGSSAVGGTVNIITKIPTRNSFDFNLNTALINGGSIDNNLSGNVTIMSKTRKAGVSVFLAKRDRQAYDHNGDNFSELPQLNNNSFGMSIYFKPTANQKVEANFTSLNEYRFGGEMIEGPAYQAQQAEERTHNVLMGGLDYQINFEKSSFIAYAAGQQTLRKHYTGITPDAASDVLAHYTLPPYGNTENYTLQGGAQFNYKFDTFLDGDNVVTLGSEYTIDDVYDTIPTYNYLTDQTTKNAAVFAQTDWEILNSLNLLAGARLDKHNYLDKPVVSPRLSLMYRLKDYTQFRVTWGTGFRAPQAFDADMHMAFAGGGISRILLADNLQAEYSNSISASVNYDKATEKFIAGFTLEGFYTHLDQAFYLQPIGSDEFGDLFEKRNGSGALVQGVSLELRANYNKKAQIEGGITIQESLYDDPVENIEGIEPSRKFLRTPNQYGFLSLDITPSEKYYLSLNSVFTGPMTIAHFAGAPEQTEDEIILSDAFTEMGAKIGYRIDIHRIDMKLEIFGGVKNILNAYQNDFDSGKYRDSNYIYGPAAPRTIYAGLKLLNM